MKHIKKVEMLLLTITILLAVICGVLVYEFVFKSYLTSSSNQKEVQTTNIETTELVYRELSQIIFAIRGYYYLRKELPEGFQQIDVNTTYNYQYAFEELEDTFRIELRGNVAISEEESLMKENSLDGELYTTYENFLYTTTIDKVFED
ncbi:MAG: hypothetical protein ACP5D6_08780 [Kosmotogaceae bacterium]